MNLYNTFKKKLLKNYQKTKKIISFRTNLLDFLHDKKLFRKKTFFHYCVINDFHDLRAANEYSNQKIMEILAQKYEVKPTQIRNILKLHLRKFD